jgi:hypothetical protein
LNHGKQTQGPPGGKNYKHKPANEVENSKAKVMKAKRWPDLHGHGSVPISEIIHWIYSGNTLKT